MQVEEPAAHGGEATTAAAIEGQQVFITFISNVLCGSDNC